MSALHILPSYGLAPGQAARLAADLAAAHEAGADLGSRMPHIRAAGANLQRMADELERVLADLQQTLESLGLHGDDVGRVLTRLVRETAALALALGAKHFPADG